MRWSASDITVVVPIYNGARYLAEAVESVWRQTSLPGRIILIDDGSTDDTPQVAAALRRAAPLPTDYLRQENGGPAAALNRGAAMSESAVLAFHAADDIWVPDKIAWQMAALNDGADLVFGHMQNFISPELDAVTAASLRCPPDPMPGHNAATLLTLLATYRKVGPLDERFRIGEFFEWYGRANDLGLTSVMLPQVVTRRRLHGNNHSLSRKTDAIGYAHVIKAMLDRRRAERNES